MYQDQSRQFPYRTIELAQDEPLPPYSRPPPPLGPATPPYTEEPPIQSCLCVNRQWLRNCCHNSKCHGCYDYWNNNLWECQGCLAESADIKLNRCIPNAFNKEGNKYCMPTCMIASTMATTVCFCAYAGRSALQISVLQIASATGGTCLIACCVCSFFCSQAHEPERRDRPHYEELPPSYTQD